MASPLSLTVDMMLMPETNLSNAAGLVHLASPEIAAPLYSGDNAFTLLSSGFDMEMCVHTHCILSPGRHDVDI